MSTSDDMDRLLGEMEHTVNVLDGYAKQIPALRVAVVKERVLRYIFTEISSHLEEVEDTIEQLHEKYPANVSQISKDLNYNIQTIESQFKQWINTLQTIHSELTAQSVQLTAEQVLSILDHLKQQKLSIDKLSQDVLSLKTLTS